VSANHIRSVGARGSSLRLSLIRTHTASVVGGIRDEKGIGSGRQDSPVLRP